MTVDSTLLQVVVITLICISSYSIVFSQSNMMKLDFFWGGGTLAL